MTVTAAQTKYDFLYHPTGSFFLVALLEDGAVLNINHQLKCCHFMWQHFILYFYFVIFILLFLFYCFSCIFSCIRYVSSRSNEALANLSSSSIYGSGVFGNSIVSLVYCIFSLELTISFFIYSSTS